MVMDVIQVEYEGKVVGALSFDDVLKIGVFEYSKEFIATGVELSPLMMPLSNAQYSFPDLQYATYKKLPGLIADSLPDDFGNQVLNAWVSKHGRDPQSITPLERLRHIGQRGMGALEYRPASDVQGFSGSKQVEILELLTIAQNVLDQRSELDVGLSKGGKADQEAMMALLSVGTSAGGARPKAVLAFNDDFTSVRSGQAEVPEGYEHYLMKFDGVSEHNKNKETFGDPQGYGAMEYAYHRLAVKCGIEMMPCELLQEGDRQHFLTRRFDRVGNKKIHTQTLNGLAHVDYKKPGLYSYAQLFDVARKLNLSAEAAEQLFRRMVFNVVARNHDDHAKNFSFMLVEDEWKLAPAYDLAFSYKPGSPWVDSHWMTLNGKRDQFEMSDFLAFEKISPIFTEDKIREIVSHTVEVVSGWSVEARDVGVPPNLINNIERYLRLYF